MKYTSQHKQLVLDPSWTSLEGLPKDNRWVKLGDSLPWDKIERIYNKRLNNSVSGAGNKPARVIIGALLIKHKMNLSDRETIQMISENPYMQYMLGLPEFTTRPVFDPSLFVTIRKRLGDETFNDMSESLLKLEVRMVEEKEKSEVKDKDNGPDLPLSSSGSNSSINPSSISRQTHDGVLKVDATCSDAEVRYPTDLDLVQDGIRIVDRVTSRLCKAINIPAPQTHLKECRSRYLNVVKLRTKPVKKVKECMEYLLTMLYRDIMTFLGIISDNPEGKFNMLKRNDRKLFITVLQIYHQQKYMFDNGVHKCESRIVSIFQPHVRPIVRGKAKAKVEFGAKIGASIIKGYTFINHNSWEAYNECDDLMIHLRYYKKMFGCLPEKFEADKIYLNIKNRRILKLLKIKICGKPLGRPSKEQSTQEYQKEMAGYVGERNEIEATFGTGKRIYRANNIRAKLPDTGESWIAACYFAKNVMKFLRGLLHVLSDMVDFILKFEISITNIQKSQKNPANNRILAGFI